MIKAHGPRPPKCPNCGPAAEFTLVDQRMDYRKHMQMGSSEVEQIPQTTWEVWECATCKYRIQHKISH